MERMSTLCYIEREGKYLMLHRTIKENDVNHGKWIGVGGHFEVDESPEECLLREVEEETGYRLVRWQFRALVTFVSGDGVTEYMHLFTADRFTGEPISCDEGGARLGGEGAHRESGTLGGRPHLSEPPGARCAIFHIEARLRW